MFSIAKKFLIIPIVPIVPLAYFAAYETLTVIVPPVLYVAGGVAMIMTVLGGVGAAIWGVEVVKTRKVQLSAARDIAMADAQTAYAEAKQKQVFVIMANRDQQVFIKDDEQKSVYRPAHLSPAYVNGHAIEASSQQVALYQQFHNNASPGNNHAALLPEISHAEETPPANILNNYSDAWIKRVVLPAPHVHFCGATRSGKTTLANHLIEHINQASSDTKFYLINPKETASRKPFIISPSCKDISDVLEGLAWFNQMMVTRKNDPNLNDDTHKIVFVIDEWDWIFQEYGQEASRLLVPLVKVGAELKIQVILIGQSPLSGDTGLSQSFYHNMVRVAIWQEGARLLNNYPLDRQYKDPLRVQYEALKETAPGHKMNTGNDLRYCVVVPMAGNPTVEVIPFLSDPQPIKEINSHAGRPKPTPEERRILVEWFRIKNEDGFSGSRLHKSLTGQTSNANSTQLQKLRDVIVKFGYKPGF